MLKSRFGFRGAAFLVFAFLAIAMTFPLVFHMSERIPGDLEDPLYNVWVMAHNIQKAFEGGRGLWNTNAFYPHQGTLLYADAIMALSAFAWPLSALSGSILFAYNGLFIFSFFLSAAGMFLLVDHLLRDRMAAFLAGLVFAFFPYNFAHLTHLELLFYGWMPFCLLFLHRYFETFKGRDLFIASAFFIVQTLSCAYYGLFFGLALAVLVPVFAFKSGTWREPRFYVHAAACIGLCAAILLPVFVPYIQVHRKMAFKRTPEAVALHSAQLQHFFECSPRQCSVGAMDERVGKPGDADFSGNHDPGRTRLGMGAASADGPPDPSGPSPLGVLGPDECLLCVAYPVRRANGGIRLARGIFSGLDAPS